VTTPARAEAAAALMAALREVAEANDRLQLACAWVLEAFGDSFDAETVRMLRIPGGPERPRRPPVPMPPRSEQLTEPLKLADQPGNVTGDESPDETGTLRHGIGMPEWMAKIVDRDRGDDL
jgi:hypothetical protein